MVLDVAIASVTPALARCAVDALERTSTTLLRVHVNDNALTRRDASGHAQKLDQVWRALPDDAEWLFVMDDDAAPLRRAWHDHLLGESAIAHFGPSRAVGCLYRVAYLRAVGASFACAPNPGDDIPSCADELTRPWCCDLPSYLTGTEMVCDRDGVIFGHLGGGTIGAGVIRMPPWLWPAWVDGYLTSHGL